MDGHTLNALRRARVAQCLDAMQALCDEVAVLQHDINQGEASAVERAQAPRLTDAGSEDTLPPSQQSPAIADRTSGLIRRSA